MPISVLPKFDPEKIRNCLKNVRKRARPPCRNPTELNQIMNENDEIYEAFGKFYSRDFYRCLIKAGNYTASLFVVEQIAESVRRQNSHIFLDGTFRTCPIGAAQVLVMFAIIEEKVY